MPEEKTAKERVKGLTTINFSVTKCPLKVYERFVAFCKKETSDNYSFGLKLLLDGMEGNIKEATLFEQYIELKARIDDLEKTFQELQGKGVKAKPKTFGNPSNSSTSALSKVAPEVSNPGRDGTHDGTSTRNFMGFCSASSKRTLKPSFPVTLTIS